jgi:hypothetical protein
MRKLRTYERMAQKTYCCDNCHRAPIFPGDVYRGEVYAHNHRIIIKRCHVMPNCSDFPDPEEVYRLLVETAEYGENLERQTVQETRPAA